MERVAEGLSIQDNNVPKLINSNQSDNLCGSIIMNDNNKIDNYIEDSKVAIRKFKLLTKIDAGWRDSKNQRFNGSRTS